MDAEAGKAETGEELVRQSGVAPLRLGDGRRGGDCDRYLYSRNGPLRRVSEAEAAKLHEEALEEWGRELEQRLDRWWDRTLGERVEALGSEPEVAFETAFGHAPETDAERETVAQLRNDVAYEWTLQLLEKLDMRQFEQSEPQRTPPPAVPGVAPVLAGVTPRPGGAAREHRARPSRSSRSGPSSPDADLGEPPGNRPAVGP